MRRQTTALVPRVSRLSTIVDLNIDSIHKLADNCIGLKEVVDIGEEMLPSHPHQ